MKRYRQIEQSRARIFDAFAGLLQRFDYGDITLSEIADHSGLTRMTLYRHFKTKDDIILYRAQKLREEADRNTADIEQVIFRRYQLAMNLPRIDILAKRGEIHEILAKHRMRSSIGMVERYTGRRFEDDPYLFRFFFGGLNEIVTRWFQAGCDATPQEMTTHTMLALEVLVEKARIPGVDTPIAAFGARKRPIPAEHAGSVGADIVIAARGGRPSNPIRRRENADDLPR